MSTILRQFGLDESSVQRALGADPVVQALDRIDRPVDRQGIEHALDLLTPARCGIPMIRLGPAGTAATSYRMTVRDRGVLFRLEPTTSRTSRTTTIRFGIKSFMCDYSSDVEKLKTPLIQGMQWFQKKLDARPGAINLNINDWVRDNTSQDRPAPSDGYRGRRVHAI